MIEKEDAKLTVAVWLHSPRVGCFCFAAEHALRVEAAVPGARVVVCHGRDEFRAALCRADVAVAWQVRREWLADATRLRWIACPAAGREGVAQVERPGLRVTRGRFHGELMAETVLAMMLAECRGLRPLLRSPQTQGWPREELDRCMRPLRGSHAVILGFGHIGQWIGRLAKPFGVRVTGIRRRAMPPPAFFEEGDRLLSVALLDEVLPEADHLVLVLPASPETDGILDSRRLARLCPHAVVYNLGRGNAVDEDALAAALRENRLRAAYLDVFQQEPLAQDSPLRGLPNAVLMPHASAFSPTYLDLFLDEFLPQLAEFAHSEPT